MVVAWPSCHSFPSIIFDFVAYTIRIPAKEDDQGENKWVGGKVARVIRLIVSLSWKQICFSAMHEPDG